jgi:nucleoside 2-deoxyribosyltransferase
VVQVVCDRIEKAGHAVPVKWWDHTSSAHEAKALPGSDDEFYSKPSVLVTAARDFGGVATCDQFVLVSDQNARKFNGALVELGYALALGKPCAVIGCLERSAMFAHVRRIEGIEELL